MVSRREVAEAAQVSMRTVSNVVNGYIHVSDKTRERVLQVINELDYRPSELARNFKSGRSGLIGLVLPELDTPYFAELTRAFVEEGASRGLTVVIDQTDGDLAREQFLIDRTYKGALFDAVVISPLALKPADLDGDLGTRPLVFLGENPFVGFDHVMIDNRAAVNDVIKHLVSTGRRRIAAIGAESTEHESSSIRLESYTEALIAAGIEPDPSLIGFVDGFRRAEGAAAMQRLLDLDNPPDSVFCFSDPLALGALRTLLTRGIRVPEDIALVGFDDVEDGAFSTPSLTSVSPDKQAIASLALDRVEARLADPDLGRGDLYTAPYRLTVRESG